MIIKTEKKKKQVLCKSLRLDKFKIIYKDSIVIKKNSFIKAGSIVK